MNNRNKELVHWVSIGIAGATAITLIFAHIVTRIRGLNPEGNISLNTLVTFGVMISMITVAVLLVFCIWGIGRKIKLWGKV